MESHFPIVYNRKSFQYKDFEKFKLLSKNFNQQYSGLYCARLIALKDHLVQKAKVKWAQCEVLTLTQLSERTEIDDCIVIGTLYKHQELKPSVLREISEELQLVSQPPRTNYASFKDILYLEDEALRIKLVGNRMNIQSVVTGIVCAVFGRDLKNGEFSVVDWCFPGYYPKVPTHRKTEKHDMGKVFIISGLDIANSTQSLSLSLLSEWIVGMIGCTVTQEEVASIVCVIIAGNSVRGSVEVHNHKKYFETKAHDEAIFKETAMAINQLDRFLCVIAQSCPIILMPGEFDPTCHMMPQQSIHPCILPKCSRFKSLYGSTNPWIGSINSRVIAGSSGQPIMDIMKVSGIDDVSPLTWLERTLEWRHYAPTMPDTVSGYPYSNTDPFVMTECPDIYFAGNMDKFDTKLITANEGQLIRLICIPKFSQTQMGVMVNLEDLKTSPISFGIN